MFKSKFALVIFIIFLTSGCIVTSANKLPKIKDSEFNFSSKNKSKVYIKFDYVSKDSDVKKKNAVITKMKKNLHDALIESGCCDVVNRPLKADVIINGNGYQINENPVYAAALISTLTLYIIPTRFSYTRHISLDVKKRTKKYSYDVQDDFTVTQWLPLIVALPFTGSPSKQQANYEKNVYRNLVVQMKKDRLFKT